MAFDLIRYLAKRGAHVVPGNLTSEICEATGYVGLNENPARCPDGRTREMAERLRKRFGNIVAARPWHAIRATYNGTALTLPTKLLIELGLMPMRLDRFKPEIMKKYADIISVGTMGEELVDLIFEVEGYDPPEQMVPTLVAWLAKLQRGEACTVVMTVCPDYSHESGVYNFSELWDGVGLVAQRALRAAMLLHQMQRHTNARLRVVVAIADFEGDSESVCSQLGITRDEFRVRCRRSQIAFRAEAERLSPGIEKLLDTPLWGELVSADAWEETLNHARHEVTEGNISGVFRLEEGELRAMAHSRAKMYRRWHGDDCNPVHVMLSQAPEYGAVGYLCATRFPNAMIFGADHVAMSPFLHMLLPALVPVLYMKKADY